MPDAPVLDHDILITLVETVKSNQAAVLDKINDVKDKVQEVNDGISTKVNDHEVRLKSIEEIIQLVQPKKSFAQLQDLITWKSQSDYKSKFIITGALLLGGFLQWILSQGFSLLQSAVLRH
jgi:hypothetical protein